MKVILLLLGVLSVLKTDVEHKFYLSKFDIHYKSDQQAIQVSSHIFIDDLEKALEEEGIPKSRLASDDEIEKADYYIEKYMNKRLNLEVDGQALYLQFIGKETSEDLMALWCYFEVTSINFSRSIYLKNDVLMEVYDDQRNIVNLKRDGKKLRTWFFDKEDNTAQYELAD